MGDLLTKVGPTHLSRDAYVYVRQSTLTQVREHNESLERQYELADRAMTLGWPPRQVVIVDEDLGRSGAEATAREGFKNLVADVGLGKVGIILGIEVSRLARNNADWYQLLDLCALTDTLIADGDGLYHPADFNDRLVLGLKGTMSEAELHLIRNRLTAGLLHKAAKGELRQGLPVGFDYDELDTVVMCPDEAVREAIATVFRLFEELGSGRQVMLSLHGDNVLIPRRSNGSPRVRWAKPSYPAIHDFLTNPVYAGAFVFGRTRTEKRIEDGRMVVRTRQVPRDEWTVLIPDHHPGFITWERYVANQDVLRANWRPRRGEGGGAAREGTALLQGRVRCGRCGRMMMVAYSGPGGNTPRYLCGAARALYQPGSACQSLGGRRLEQRVLAEVFSVLEPAALAATAKAITEAETQHRQRLGVFELAVERARCDADRARRQFEACEPENRLVGRNLERAWEQALGRVRQAEAELTTQRTRRPTELTATELAWVAKAGADVRAIFQATSTTDRDRKQLLRAIIAEVVVVTDVEARQAQVRIAWEGGATTALTMALNKTGGHFRTTDTDTVEVIRQLTEHYNDTSIAIILARQGRRTGTGLAWTQTRVKSLRTSQGIPAFVAPVAVTPEEDNAVVVSITQAERILGVSRVTLYRWLDSGFITGEQLMPHAPWRIRIDDTLRAKIVPEVPDGWLNLDQAARTLGVARQTVLHKVQRGELEAVHVSHGRRNGLRIKVDQPATGLFDTPR
ncbi:MAG: recombinase family protein [Actinomycetota bacterium]|nr:recombinase family protein [Actinomycetota bacterium]